jgi:hypothetical protein
VTLRHPLYAVLDVKLSPYGTLSLSGLTPSGVREERHVLRMLC